MTYGLDTEAPAFSYTREELFQCVKKIVAHPHKNFTSHDEAENQTHRVELTVDNDGVFITSCEGGAREDMSIAQKDLAIAVARAILEAYGEV